MNKTKYLVTGGCSFTAYNGCWPYWLSKAIPHCKLFNTAIGSSDNSLIARKTIYMVHKLIQDKKDPKDIIVGIMWSNSNRKSWYSDRAAQLDQMFQGQDWEELLRTTWNTEPNPHVFPPGVTSSYVKKNAKRKNKSIPTDINDTQGLYLLITPGMSEELYPWSQNYYKQYHNNTTASIETLENILRVQWFLKHHKIKYFMVPYMDEWICDYLDKEMSHPQLDYLEEMIDKKRWLPVTSEKAWLNKNSKLDSTAWDPIQNKSRDANDPHPSSPQHKEFVEKVVLPWMKNKRLIDE